MYLVFNSISLPRMMDPIVLYYGKGQLTGFLADPNGVLDVVSNVFVLKNFPIKIIMFDALEKH